MLSLGQVLKGKIGSYKITSKLENAIWLAIATNQFNQSVIVKHSEHFDVSNERDMPLRFQGKTPYIRPLIDEVDLGAEARSPALVLRYLDEDLQSFLNRRTLTRRELKFVARGVLRALKVLHAEGFVHTDIKPKNVLVNYDAVQGYITEVQLADLESALHQDSKPAVDGDPIGTPIFRSTEAFLQMRWGPSTDVWSFGAMVISLLYGQRFHVFKPDVPPEHEDYDMKILLKHNRHFGPFPISFQQIAGEDQLEVATWLMNNSPPETVQPFAWASEEEISWQDKEFVLKMMKLDPRARPRVEDLLTDIWLHEP